MRGDFDKRDRERRTRLKVMLACQAVGWPLMGLAVWLAYHFANEPATAVERDTVVSWADAKEMTRSYSDAVSGAPLVLARGGDFPERKFPGLKLSVNKLGATNGRVHYDIVAYVGSASICSGAITGGRRDVSSLQVGDVVLPPPALIPYRNGKQDVNPAGEICEGKPYPLTLRFTHIQAVGEGVQAGR